MPGQRVLLGHVDPRRGFVIDVAVARALVAGAETGLSLVLAGSTVSVLVGGQIVLSYAYNAAVTDGAAGLVTRTGAGSFDSFRLRTDDPALAGPVLPSVSIADATVVEGASGSRTVTLQLTLSSAATAPVSVAWSTTSGSATAGSDFVGASGTVTFAAGATTASISLTIFGDTVVEPDESFGVNLSAPVGLTVADGSALVVIANDDASPLPSVSIADATVVEGASGTRTVTLQLTLSSAASAPVSVGWATSAGSATAGSDFATASGTVTFAAGATTASISLTIFGDTVVEPDESFGVNLSAPVGLTIADGSALVVIANDDASSLPSLSIADASVVEGNSGNKTVTLTVTLSAASSSAVTVQYATVNGTATAGSDYRVASGTITFAAGVTSRTFTVTILGDKTKEPNETFRVTLSAASGATILDGDATVTIVTDEAALTAAYAPLSADPARALTSTELASAAAEAKSAWLRLRPGAEFSSVTFAIADLPELLLAGTSGSTITVDATAAGWGWSVSYRRSGGRHMDLVAALMHELGHVLGLEHADEGLMADTLAPMISSRGRAVQRARPVGMRMIAAYRALLPAE